MVVWLSMSFLLWMLVLSLDNLLVAAPVLVVVHTVGCRSIGSVLPPYPKRIHSANVVTPTWSAVATLSSQYARQQKHIQPSTIHS